METLTLAHGAIGLKSLNYNPRFPTFSTKSRQFFIYSSHSSFLCAKPVFPSLNRLFPHSNFRRCAIRCVASDHHYHDANHNDVYDHDHDHHHRHGDAVKLNKFQEGFLRFAKAIGWVDLANYLRENLQLCCSSMALFLAAAACPYLVPKPLAKSLHDAFIILAFPLVGVILFLWFPSKSSPFFYCLIVELLYTGRYSACVQCW